MAPSENADRLVLVSGANGTQGGAVATRLLQRGFRVRALTRHPTSAAIQALTEHGAEICVGDFADPDSLKRATRGAHGVFSVQNFTEGTSTEIRHGQALADAAASAGVAHFVYSSAGAADQRTGISFHDSKFEVEQHIRALPLPFTILRPVFFMRNWFELQDHILAGELPWPLHPEQPLQQIAVRDIARAVSTALEAPGEWLGRVTEIAGDELTLPEVSSTFARVINRPVTYRQVPLDHFMELLSARTGTTLDANFRRMFEWFDRVGYAADIPALRKEIPELSTLEQYLRASA